MKQSMVFLTCLSCYTLSHSVSILQWATLLYKISLCISFVYLVVKNARKALLNIHILELHVGITIHNLRIFNPWKHHNKENSTKKYDDLQYSYCSIE